MTTEPSLVLLVMPEDHTRFLELLGPIRKSTKASLIVIGSTLNASSILDVLHEGADDFLDENRDIPSQLASMLARMEIKSDTATETGHVTIVTAPCGGSGGSVVAENLAVLIAKQHQACVLLDYDLRKGDQASLLNLKPRHTISDLCRNLKALDYKMLEQSLVGHDSGVKLLSAPLKSKEASTISAGALTKIIQLARCHFSQIVVDLADPRTQGVTELLPMGNKILIVFRLDFPSLCNLTRILEDWEEWGLSTQNVELVANRCGGWDGISVEKAEKSLGREIAHRIVDDPMSLHLSVNCGIPVVTEWSTSKFAKSLRQIADKLMHAPSENSKANPHFFHLPSMASRFIERLVATWQPLTG
jgi:pilus assembly protein CpaE